MNLRKQGRYSKRWLRLNGSIIDLTQKIAFASDLEQCCELVAQYTRLNGGELLTVKFCDWTGQEPTVRPYSRYPDGVRAIGRQLQEFGGCAISQESKARLTAFSYSSIERSKYNTLLHRRFFQEVDKLGYRDIAIFPVVVGRGMAIANVGIKVPFDERTRSMASGIASHVSAAIAAKFPEVGRLFDGKVLTDIETRILGAFAKGETEEVIGKSMNLGSFTISAVWQSAASKLGAHNRYDAIKRAITIGELDGH